MYSYVHYATFNNKLHGYIILQSMYKISRKLLTSKLLNITLNKLKLDRYNVHGSLS